MTYWRSFAHLVWATKDRRPFIRPEMEAQLYACLVSKAAELDCCIHAVNGTEDHVHVVISIPPKHSVALVVKHLKGNSSHFVNHVLSPPEAPFAWQRGYGYLSLGESQCERAIAYVENQKAHHQTQKTNVWLERTDDDEAMGGRSTGNQSQDRSLKESSAAYFLDDFPF